MDKDHIEDLLKRPILGMMLKFNHSFILCKTLSDYILHGISNNILYISVVRSLSIYTSQSQVLYVQNSDTIYLIHVRFKIFFKKLLSLLQIPAILFLSKHGPYTIPGIFQVFSNNIFPGYCYIYFFNKANINFNLS